MAKKLLGQQQKTLNLPPGNHHGERFEVSNQRYVEPAKWSIPAGKFKGGSEDARSINQHLDSFSNGL
jgi:hypothetical protein